MATDSVVETQPNVKPQIEDTTPVVCALGNPLDDCPAKRAGCGSHYEMLKFMFPPLIVRSYVKAQMADNAEVLAWLARLDSVLPGLRNDMRWWR